jgi:nitroreductase
MFLPRPVPRELVDEALALAQHAPSNSNIQPWRLVFVCKTVRDRLKDALFRVADHEAPHRHRQLVGSGQADLGDWEVHQQFISLTNAADFRPDLECLGPRGSVLGGSDVIAAEMEQVVDLIVG